MPPTLPEPDALDQIKLGSTGSGVAQPLSPPATVCHMLRGIVAPTRLLLGPRYDGPSCLFPITLYGIELSTVTWYICAFGNRFRYQVRPRLLEIEKPWS